MNGLNKYRTLFNIVVKLFQDKDAWDYATSLNKLSYEESFQEFVRYNKMLTTVAYILDRTGLSLPEVYSFKLRRYQIYFKEAQRISDNFEREGVEYSVIKTFSIVPKDISDIDLLVNREQRSLAERVLQQLGYIVRKESMEQDLFSRKVGNVVIDVELHTSIAASGYEYYNSQRVLKGSRHINGVRVPSVLDSILIIASHDIMKDLYIPLIHVIEVFMYLNDIDCKILFNYALSQGLVIPLTIFLGLIEYISGQRLICNSAWRSIYTEISLDLAKILRLNLTIKVPILLTLLAYIDNFKVKSSHEGLFTVLKQTLSLLNSKGIRALLLNLPGEEPDVKSVWE